MLNNMRKNNLKINKEPILLSKSGFTLIETLIAILILTLTLNAFFTLISNSIFSAQYARNKITANYLAQEAIDYIRNDRDSIAFQNNDWDGFIQKYDKCLTEEGCYFDVLEDPVQPKYCQTSSCQTFYYNSNSGSSSIKNYYTYTTTLVETPFERRIIMTKSNLDQEIDITVKVKWLNGKTAHTKILTTSLLNWR